jgi:hypothetical protein
VSAPPEGGDLPARRLSSQELEAVIRRAVELQAAAEGGDDGITEGEVLRIGKELGLAPEVVRRAIADIRSRPVEEKGLVAGVMGPGVVRAARTVRRPAAEVGLLMEQYLFRCEYMVVLRRFSDRTRYVPASGMGAALGRAAYRLRAQHTALGFHQLDVGVSAVDDDCTLVELSMELRGMRKGLAAGGVGSGGALAALAGAFAWATPAPDLLALAGLPALAATLLGSRGIYRAAARSRQEKLESLLDRLEHGELKAPAGNEWKQGLDRLLKG